MKLKILTFPANVVLLFGVLGIVMSCIAAGMIQHKRAFIARAERVPGQVVALERGHDVVFPVFEYVTKEWEERRLTGSIGSSPPAYRVGEAVEIYYDPQSSHRAEVVGFFEQWWASGMMAVFGILLLPLLVVAWRIR